jgi:hypothetical protein
MFIIHMLITYISTTIITGLRTHMYKHIVITIEKNIPTVKQLFSCKSRVMQVTNATPSFLNDTVVYDCSTRRSKIKLHYHPEYY